MCDPYINPNTGVLINKVAATSYEELAEVEYEFVYARSILLHTADIPRANSLEELKAIHLYLFQDVYEWAGQTRVVDIRKNADNAGWFLPHSKIETACAWLFEELGKKNMLQGMDRAQFVEHLAYYYGELNFIHPFREGNGRTQRLFWSRIAHDAGWELEWNKVSSSENNFASHQASQEQDTQPLVAMFGKVVAENKNTASGVSWSPVPTDFRFLSYPKDMDGLEF